MITHDAVEVADAFAETLLGLVNKPWDEAHLRRYTKESIYEFSKCVYEDIVDYHSLGTGDDYSPPLDAMFSGISFLGLLTAQHDNNTNASATIDRKMSLYITVLITFRLCPLCQSDYYKNASELLDAYLNDTITDFALNEAWKVLMDVNKKPIVCNYEELEGVYTKPVRALTRRGLQA